MTALKLTALVAVLTGPMLIASVPAEAFTARQATSGGQGIYATSSGMPVNFVGNASTAEPGTDGNRGEHQPHDMQHHGRYFGGY